jgi:cytochrome P450
MVAINVLSRIAYGHSKSYSQGPSPSLLSADTSYLDAISLVTEHLIIAEFLPASILRLPIMPQLLQRLGAALKRLPDLTRAMLDRERNKSIHAPQALGRMIKDPKSTPETIMKTLVRLSEQEMERSDESDPTPSGRTSTTYLTEEEIAGNLFIFTAAGFDTSANTLCYAIALLAANPEWQTWIQIGIDTVLGEDNLLLSDYEMVFPELIRCLAVMVVTRG